MFEENIQRMLARAGDFLVFEYKAAPTASFSRGDRYASLQGCGMTLSTFRSGSVNLYVDPDAFDENGFEEDGSYQDDQEAILGLAWRTGATRRLLIETARGLEWLEGLLRRGETPPNDTKDLPYTPEGVTVMSLMAGEGPLPLVPWMLRDELRSKIGAPGSYKALEKALREEEAE